MKTIEELPVIMGVDHIAKALDISKASAYELMRQKDFPVILIGRLKRVNRDAFVRWLDKKGGCQE